MISPEQRKLLLLVEDDIQMVRLLKDALASEGFSIIASGSAEDALHHAHAEHPDLVVLDLMLPGIDGMSFLDNIRKEVWGKHLPVIILTNVSPDDKIVSGITRDEPAYYLIKANTSMDEIIGKVKNVLGLDAPSA